MAPGLFDESDSDDDGAVPAGAAATLAANDDEGEDPLDAYMNSLAAAPAAADSAPAVTQGGRLDMDAEDEATSHWEVTAATSASDTHQGLLPPPEDRGDRYATASAKEAAAREARAAMSNTFVAVGGSNSGKKRQQAPGEHPQQPDGHDDDKEEAKRRQAHEEVDPLERINHGDVRYAPFQRAFYRPPDTAEGAAWRREHEVVCAPSVDPVLGFGELSGDGGGAAPADGEEERGAVFPPALTTAIARAGYDAPTLVQSQTLAVALSGRDALITAATGSGKTLAYIWPMVIHINDQPHIVPGTDGPIGIVLTPTRELAKQVYHHARTFVGAIGGTVVEVAGGNRGTWELTKQLRRGCEVVVSSPGRLIDMVKKKGTNLRRVTFLVLDEADRMLSMGFEKQVTSILNNVRPDRQTLLLSATFGKRVEKVARGWLRHPVRIAIGRTGASSEHVDSHVMVLPDRNAKVQWLLEMLPHLSPLGRCLIFVGTRVECDDLASLLGGTSCGGAAVVSIHGDKDQRERNRAISHFKKHACAVLVATDVAARGLDIPDVMAVVSFDPAKNMDAHVHRVGRAGRLRRAKQADGDAGDGGIGRHQKGVAYTLLTRKDANFAASLAEAFDREGREVSPELAALGHKSNRYGGGRTKHSKVGLGFDDDKGSSKGGIQNASYHGSAFTHPAKKKSRWG